jgi:hypothetical protein
MVMPVRLVSPLNSPAAMLVTPLSSVTLGAGQDRYLFDFPLIFLLDYV